MKKNKLNILNRVFTRNTFQHFIDGKKDDTYVSVVRRYISQYEGKTNRTLISEIYLELKNNYQNEYYYKNTLLNKLLIGIHSTNTTTALTEIPICNSKADFILINGKAVVYEIKSELDNFERLETQVNDYYKAFDHVAVITSEDRLEKITKKIEEINKPIGIYILQKNGRIKTVIQPKRYIDDIDLEVLFKILRKSEFENILYDKYGQLPEVSQFEYYKACKTVFLDMDMEDAYYAFLNQLKQRALLVQEEFDKIPYELKFLGYFMKLKENDYRKLHSFLEEEYGGR